MLIPPLSLKVEARTHLSWQRYLCPRGGRIPLDYEGYMNPRLWYLGALERSEDRREPGCTVILGEPGIGKSAELYAQYMRESALSQSCKPVWLDLRYCSDNDYFKQISQEDLFQEWLANDESNLHVFIENMELCRIDRSVLADIFGQWLNEFDRQRLCLTFAARTFTWSPLLENILQELFRDQLADPNTHLVYELAPLQRSDVEQLAKVELAEKTEHFMAAVQEFQLQPFAIKPLTLKSLLRRYKQTGAFPKDIAELYATNCETLAEEQNKTHRESVAFGKLTSKQLVAASTRVAAVSMFCARDISTAPLTDGASTDAIRLDDLAGGNANFLGQCCTVSRESLGACLNTGLFSSRGVDRFGFAHQAYGEYLAAQYLIERKCPSKQIFSLIFNARDPERRLVPSLQGVAAWLASQLADVFDEVAKRDPVALFLAGIEDICLDKRSLIVCSYLDSLKDRKKPVGGVRHLYPKLAHDGIENTLRVHLNKDSSKIARHEAILLAEACGAKELANDLLVVINDVSEHYEIRSAAMFALESMPGSFDTQAIKTYVVDDRRDDIRDDLKGHAMIALWPKHISASDLFNHLTPPKDERYGGAYVMFLSYTLPKSLSESDLLVALEWACTEINLDRKELGFETLIDELIIQAFHTCINVDVAKILGQLSVLRITKQYHLIAGSGRRKFYETDLDDTAARRRLLSAIFNSPYPESKRDLLVASTLRQVARADDFGWLLEQLKAITRMWQNEAIDLLRCIYSYDRPDHLEDIFGAASHNRLIQDSFGWLLRPVLFGSKEEERLRKQQEYSSEKTERKLLEPPPSERIEQLLTLFDSGKTDRWYFLSRELTLEPDSEYYTNLEIDDVRALPGWLAASRGTRERILRCAYRYLFDVDPKFAGGVQIPEIAFAGYKALVLMLNEAPEKLFNVPWEHWVGIILSFHTQSSESKATAQKLFDMVYEANPGVAAAAVKAVIEAESEHFKYLFVLGKLPAGKMHLLVPMLTELLESNVLPNQVQAEILAGLLDNKSAAAIDWAHHHIDGRNLSGDLAVIAAANLICHDDTADWKYLWPIITNDAEFGKLVLVRTAEQSFLFGDLVDKLNDDDLAHLYLWLISQFPPESENPEKQIVWSAGPDSLVHNLRDSIPVALQKRSSDASCKALAYICDTIPGLNGVQNLLYETRAELARKNWRPVSPDVLIKMTDNSRLRLVESAEQLMSAVVESLQNLQQKLKDEGGAIWALWDEVGAGHVKPKIEKRLSQHVANYLNDVLNKQGVIINCEVEIRPGQETDIHIDAVKDRGPDSGFGRISLIIETKGLWNPKVNTEMETQLVDRYLKDNRCCHGIYLVGYYNCNGWDRSDWRQNRCQNRGTIETVRTEFIAQAEALAKNRKLNLQAFVLDASLPEDVLTPSAVPED